MPLLERGRRERAESVIEREYDELRRPTLTALRSKLGARGIRFDDSDLEAFYNQAWHGLYLRLAEGEQIDNHGGFLVQAAFFRAIDELRRTQPERRADAADLEAAGTEPDLAAQLDDHAQLRQFMEGMRERLSEREREAVTLCYIHGCSRPQAAELLGVSPKRMEKLMDGASRKVGVLVEDISDGSWCETRGSLMKAYAFGVLDPDGERAALAAAHLRECPGCRRYVRGLRGIAAIAPPVALPLALMGALGAAGGHAAAGAAGASSGAGGGGAAAGAGTATAGAGGGIGTAGAALAASVVVAAGGFGVYKAVSHDGGAHKVIPPAQTTTVPATAAAPAATTQSSSSAKKAKRAAKRKAARKRAAATATGSATTASPAAATMPSATTSPGATTTPSTPASPPAATSPAASEPTTDGTQEFGFEH